MNDSNRHDFKSVKTRSGPPNAAANAERPASGGKATIDGVYFLSMEYIDGKPLSHYIRGGKVTQRSALTAARLVALAMAEAHRIGVIHRDLKPGNIMVNARRQPVVMDFGLALEPGSKR